MNARFGWDVDDKDGAMREFPTSLPVNLEATGMKRPGCKPMDFTGRPMKGYVFVDPAGTDTEAALREWLQLALDFNSKAKSSKKSSTRRP